MESNKKFKLVVIVFSLALILISLVIASFAWYANSNVVDSSNSGIVSKEVPKLNTQIPNDFINTELYSGQTGIEYEGVDAPYVAIYSPMVCEAENLKSETMCMKARICGMNISLSGKDASGNRIEEIYGEEKASDLEFLSKLTFRMKLKQTKTKKTVNGVVSYDIVDVNKYYMAQNNYIVDELNGTPLNMTNGVTYIFDLNIIFQSEEGYLLLQKTKAKIADTYKCPISENKYMFSKIKILFDIGLYELNKINLASNGGECVPFVSTTGKATVSLPTPKKAGYSFIDWYYDEAMTIPFGKDSLLTKPIVNDITIYAKYIKNSNVTFEYNTAGKTPEIVEVKLGEIVAKPAPDPVKDGYAFVGWATQNTDYANFATFAYDFNKPVNADMTLYAIWRKIYTVNLYFDQNRDNLGDYKGTLTRYDLSADGITYTATIVSNDPTVITQRYYKLEVLDGQNLADYFVNDTESPKPGQKVYYKINSSDGKSFQFWSRKESNSMLTYLGPLVTKEKQEYSTAINGNLAIYAYYKP